MYKCADEGDTCWCDTQIFYGEERNGSINSSKGWATELVSGNTYCTNYVFGDPLPGVRKACFCAVESYSGNQGYNYNNYGYGNYDYGYYNYNSYNTYNSYYGNSYDYGSGYNYYSRYTAFS